MNKGVIVQFEQDQALILKNDGSFISCPRHHEWQIGDVIGVPKPRFNFFSRKMLTLSLSLVAFVFAGVSFTIYQTPVTVIELSVNPSVQLSANRFNRVLEVRGLNAAGESIISGMTYRHHSLTEVQHRLMSRLSNNGYFTNASLQFVVAQDSFTQFLSIEETLRQVFDQHLSHDHLRVSIIRFDMNDYQAQTHPLPIWDIPDLEEAGEAPPIHGMHGQHRRHGGGRWQDGWWRWEDD